MRVNGVEFEKFDIANILNIKPTKEEPSLYKNAENEQKIFNDCNMVSDIPKRFFKTSLKNLNSKITTDVQKFCTQKENDKIFLISGPSRTGKTSILCAAIHERALIGLNGGLYLSMRILSPLLRSARSFSAKENELAIIEKYSTTSFLCLDELGTAENLQEESNFLRTIIALRYDNLLPTMIATNLDILGFKLLLVGKSLTDFKTRVEAESYMTRITSNEPIINRLKEVAEVHFMKEQRLV